MQISERCPTDSWGRGPLSHLQASGLHVLWSHSYIFNCFAKPDLICTLSRWIRGRGGLRNSKKVTTSKWIHDERWAFRTSGNLDFKKSFCLTNNIFSGIKQVSFFPSGVKSFTQVYLTNKYLGIDEDNVIVMPCGNCHRFL